MQVRFQDFNGVADILGGTLAPRWKELVGVLEALPLYLKASDQRGKEGSPIFDPVAANAGIKDALSTLDGWRTNLPIPDDVAFLGTDVDFFHSGFLVEAQFSNYPFFLNNVVRSALLAKSRSKMGDGYVTAVGIIAKAHMFPSSNSTLYYEQAVKQMTEFAKHGVFDVPIRVIGLFAAIGTPVVAVWSEYPGRYSRVPARTEKIHCRLEASRNEGSISRVTIIHG